MFYCLEELIMYITWNLIQVAKEIREQQLRDQ